MIYAHDFNMEFCGYGSDVSGSAASALPSVYEIFVNTGACSNNYCPLDIVSYGSGSFPTSDYEPANPLTAGTLVGSVGRVWCDTACRTLGVSCWSIDAAAGQGMADFVAAEQLHDALRRIRDRPHSAYFQLLLVHRVRRRGDGSQLGQCLHHHWSPRRRQLDADSELHAQPFNAQAQSTYTASTTRPTSTKSTRSS